MRVITATREAQLFLGKRGENLATQIQFPVVEQWTEQFGEGRFELAYQRPTEDAPYPCIVDVEDGNVLWNITDVELAIPGTGRAELFYIVDEAIAISVQYICRIADSLASGTPPEPWENWLEQILSAASDAEDARDEAVEASEDAVQAKTDAVDAKDLAVSSAESASADAERAETARAYAEIANDAAQDAKTYAVDAKDVAVVASAEAIGAKEDALEASTDAINAASDAETYMNVALGAKEDAEDARDSALGAVNDIANYANTASSAAASALHSADVASQAAENIEEVIPQHKGEYSATTTYKMNDIVSYNGATYWHYAAAESKGKAPSNSEYWVLVNSATKSIASISKTGTAGLVDTYTISYTDNSTPSSFTVTNGQRGSQITTGTSLPATGMITGDLFIKTPDYTLYQYSGSAWTEVGGILDTDDTLTEEGVPADAKAVGDALSTKADKDGYYEDLSVGRADNIISNIAVTDKAPYSFRTAGGSLEIGDTVKEKALVGGTVRWRQMMMLTEETGLYTKENVSMAFDATDKTITIASTTSDTGPKYAGFSLGTNDVYYLCGYVQKGNNVVSASLGFASSSNALISGKSITVTGDDEEYFECVYKASSGDRFTMKLDNSEPQYGEATFGRVMCFNLSSMYGTDDVPNYLNTLEASQAGAGCDAFRSLFPNDYYEGATNDDSVLLSVNVAKKKVVGFNAYNNATGTARLLGGYQYQITGTYTALAYATMSGASETITPDSDGYFTPNEGGTLTVTGGNGTTTCVHLVWDGERDGDYEEYEAHEYEYDNSLVLNGIFKASGGKLQNSGDIYYNDGTVKRVYGYVDLGTLTPDTVGWRSNANGTGWYYSTSDIKMKSLPNTSTKGNIICSKYRTRTYAQVYDRTYEGVSNSNSNTYVYFWQRDTSLNTKAKVKAAMSGVYLVWEKYTTTTESATGFQETQVVDNWGTEEYVDYGVAQGTRVASVPAGHISDYPVNLKAKIEVAPDAPEQDGVYLMQRENGENRYVPKEAELPDPPGNNSAYSLMCDASGEEPSIEWLPPLVITLTDDGEGGYTVNKTMQEINEAYWKGQRLVLYYPTISGQVELTFMHTDLYTFMFTYGSWLLQGEIRYIDTTYVEIKRSVILDATGLDDHNRLPFVNVNMSTQVPTVEWERLNYGIDITYDSQNDRYVTEDTLGDIRAEMSKHAILYLKPNGVFPLFIGEFINDGGNTVLLFQEVDSVGAKVWTLVGVSDDAPAIVYPPQTYLASVPFVITLTQSGFDFSIDKTIAEITEAYQQNRPIWLQGVVTMDGSTFFNFKSQLNGVVSRGDGLDWYPPNYTFVVEYDTGGNGVYHMVVSCYINADDEDAVRVTPIVLS